jgi:hypothetical protein
MQLRSGQFQGDQNKAHVREKLKKLSQVQKNCYCLIELPFADFDELMGCVPFYSNLKFLMVNDAVSAAATIAKIKKTFLTSTVEQVEGYFNRLQQQSSSNEQAATILQGVAQRHMAHDVTVNSI